MPDQLRRPSFFLSITLMVTIVLVELASISLIGVKGGAAAALDAPTPGLGISYLAILDGQILYSVVLIGLSLLIPEALHGRLQGIITLLVSLLFSLLSVVMLISAIGLLMLMISLLIAPIFGTLAYFALYADFDRDSAAITLSVLTALKIGFGLCLLLAQQRFLQNKGLLAIIVVSLLANLLLALLHGLVPGFLVSMTDMLGAVIIAVLALIWSLIFLIGAVVSVFKAVI